MKFIYNDGGRKDAGYKGSSSDCVTRAISIATQIPYQDVYNSINELSKKERITKRKRKKSNAETGVFKRTIRKYMKSIGWKWVPTMFVGKGCKVHLIKNELPSGRLVVNVSKHCVAVINGVIYDTHDPSRNGKRCVYGYYMKNN